MCDTGLILRHRVYPAVILAFLCAVHGRAHALPFDLVGTLELPTGLASVDLSPDRQTLAGVAWYAPWIEGVRVFDTETFAMTGDHVDSANTNWSLRVTASGQSCWTTQFYDGNVREIDLATGATLRDVPVGPWPGPLALDRGSGMLYVGINASGRHEGGQIAVVDTNIGSLVGVIPLVNEPSHDLRLSSDGGLLYVHTRSPGSRTLYKIDTSDFSVLGTVPVPGAGERSMTLSPDDSRLYVPVHAEDRVDVYDADTLELIDQLFMPRVFTFSVSPKDPRFAIALHPDSNFVDVFDLEVRAIVQTFEATSTGYVADMVWDPRTGRAYVPSNGPGGSVLVLDYIIPEPATIGLLAAGMVGALWRRRARRAAA